MIKGYEMVIGLEVHVELKTASKIFCSCSTKFGALPNTQCCPVCTGMPGTLPVLNKKVVDLAITAGIATDCEIARHSKQDRKNYFYPDLPKAYQISQYDLPLCTGGHVDISGGKSVRIHRIHIEEDAGKLVHGGEGETFCDYNRCGVPLIEIVTEPDIANAEEASEFLRKLRAILMYTNVSDCKMQEGSMRCDVNLSVRKPGQELGTRTEMKNLNSFVSISKAIEFEYARQVEEIENGGSIVQETRRFDQNTGKTYSMRTKEDADDYRYFPDPDLPLIELEDADIEKIMKSLPILPAQREKEYMEKFGINAASAGVIVSEPEICDYFERAAELSTDKKMLSNLLLSSVFALMTGGDNTVKIAEKSLADIANYTSKGEISAAAAKETINGIWDTDTLPKDYLDTKDLWQQSDPAVLEPVVLDAIASSDKIIADIKSGKEKAMMALIGKIMKATKGKANATVVRELIDKHV